MHVYYVLYMYVHVHGIFLFYIVPFFYLLQMTHSSWTYLLEAAAFLFWPHHTLSGLVVAAISG